MRHLTALGLALSVFGFVVAPVTAAYAQGGFTDSGSVVHLTTAGDRVGIGTTAPGAKLHVTGNVRVDGRIITSIVSGGVGQDLRFRIDNVDALRLEGTPGTPNIIGGFKLNDVSPGVEGATIAGGGTELLFDFDFPNIVTDDFGTIGGGFGNQAGDAAGTTKDAPGATVGGGTSNRATGITSTIGGGVANLASGQGSTIGGGSNNVASGAFSTVPGGRAGNAIHAGSFVWADDSIAIQNFSSLADHSFRVRSTGGAQFVSAVTIGGVATAGVTLAAGGGSWASISDRGVKENIAPMDGADILRRLSAIPITRWNLKAQDPAIKHAGPMAQDFYAAFGLGEDERYINSADVDGIALVSIQALHQLVTALERKTADLERIAAGVEELRDRLTRFEKAAAAR